MVEVWAQIFMAFAAFARDNYALLSRRGRESGLVLNRLNG
jgi:hypothetical protein